MSRPPNLVPKTVIAYSASQATSNNCAVVITCTNTCIQLYMYLYLGSDKILKGNEEWNEDWKGAARQITSAWSTIAYSDCLPLTEIVFV